MGLSSTGPKNVLSACLLLGIYLGKCSERPPSKLKSRSLFMSILIYHLIVHLPLAMKAGRVKQLRSGEERKEEFPNLFCSQKSVCHMPKAN